MWQDDHYCLKPEPDVEEETMSDYVFKKCRKLPVVVKAAEFTNETKDALFTDMGGYGGTHRAEHDDDGNPILVIQTLEGDMVASLGDFIIRDIEGEYYPCKPDIFAKTYVFVEEE